MIRRENGRCRSQSALIEERVSEVYLAYSRGFFLVRGGGTQGAVFIR